MTRAAWLSVVLVTASACGFGDYHTQNSNSSNSSSSGGSSGGAGGATSSSGDVSSSVTGSTSSGMVDCPIPPGSMTTEDCWTRESETAAGNAACAALASTPLFAEDTSTARVRVQRLRTVSGIQGTPVVYAIGSRNAGVNNMSGRTLFAPAASLTPAYVDQPQVQSADASDFAEATDYTGDLLGGWLVGYARGDTDTLTNTNASAPFLFGVNVAKLGDPAMTGHITGAMEASGTAYSRMLAAASASVGSKAFGVARVESGAGTCGSQTGVLGVTFATTDYGLDADQCVPIATPCDGTPAEQALVPFDLLLSGGGAVVVGQSCGQLGVPSGHKTGVVVRMLDGAPPTIVGNATSAVVAPDDLQSSADIVGIRAAGDHFVIAGTFTGSVTAGGFHFASEGGVDAFVAVLDASFMFTQAQAFGGPGDDVVSDLIVVDHDVTTPAPAHTEYGVVLVGHVAGGSTWGCDTTPNDALERAFIAKLRLPSLDAASSPEVLYFHAFGLDADTRAERIASDDTTLYVSGRLATGGAVLTSNGKYPSSPFTNPTTFIAHLPLLDAVTP